MILSFWLKMVIIKTNELTKNFNDTCGIFVHCIFFYFSFSAKNWDLWLRWNELWRFVSLKQKWGTVLDHVLVGRRYWFVNNRKLCCLKIGQCCPFQQHIGLAVYLHLFRRRNTGFRHPLKWDVLNIDNEKLVEQHLCEWWQW